MRIAFCLVVLLCGCTLEVDHAVKDLRLNKLDLNMPCVGADAGSDATTSRDQ